MTAIISDVEVAGKGEGTSVKAFLQKNPNLALVKAARDSKGGVFKFLDVAIFGFLLFSPALPIIPTMKEPAVVLTLWVLICLIMWCKIEYNHRAEVWYFCLCRGIILDFPKTNTLKGWLLQKPTLVAIVFLLTFGIVTYIGLDPGFRLDDYRYALSAVLSVVGLLFVLLMTRAYVDVEGAPQLLTLNLVIHLFEDPEMLRAKGFKVVHSSNLQAFMNRKKRAGDKSFSWDEVHALSHQPEQSQNLSLCGGTKLFLFLNQFKDSEDPVEPNKQ